MKNARISIIVLIASLVLGIGASYAAPSITIDKVSNYKAPNGFVLGSVSGIKPVSDYRVAVFIEVDGGWWTKPLWSTPLTRIIGKRWRCDITTGGRDAYATKVAAYLVPKGYSPPLLGGQTTIPPELEANALAKAEVYRGNTRDEEVFSQDPDDGKDIYLKIGDSQTAITDWEGYFKSDVGYPDVTVENLGISGATTIVIGLCMPHLLKNLDPFAIEKAFINAGIDNILKRGKPAAIAKSMGKLIDKVRKLAPNANVYLESLLPTDAGDSINSDVMAVNHLLESLALEKGVVFIDVHTSFAGSDGMTAKDGLMNGVHPTKAGQELWWTVLMPYFQE